MSASNKNHGRPDFTELNTVMRAAVVDVPKIAVADTGKSIQKRIVHTSLDTFPLSVRSVLGRLPLHAELPNRTPLYTVRVSMFQGLSDRLGGTAVETSFRRLQVINPETERSQEWDIAYLISGDRPLRVGRLVLGYEYNSLPAITRNEDYYDPNMMQAFIDSDDEIELENPPDIAPWLAPAEPEVRELLQFLAQLN